MGYVLFGVVAVLCLASAAIRYTMTGRRRAALFGFATRFGLDYARNDPFGLIDHRFALFDRADGARCQNVVWGNWHGTPGEGGRTLVHP